MKMAEVASQRAIRVTGALSGQKTFEAVFTDAGGDTTNVEISGLEGTQPAQIQEFVENCAST
jgi:hypothetical protein